METKKAITIIIILLFALLLLFDYITSKKIHVKKKEAIL